MENNTYPSESKLKGFLKSLRMNESTISMFLGTLVVVIVGILVYNYFSSINKPEPAIEEGVKLVEEAGELVPDKLPVTHTVAEGEHLWAIAERYYDSGYNWVDITEANGLANANMIAAGQELTIPRTGVIKPAVAGVEAETPSILVDSYTVEKGDYLWDIAVRAYGDGYQWTKIWEANQEMIGNPDEVEIGMMLKLPR